MLRLSIDHFRKNFIVFFAFVIQKSMRINQIYLQMDYGKTVLFYCCSIGAFIRMKLSDQKKPPHFKILQLIYTCIWFDHIYSSYFFNIFAHPFLSFLRLFPTNNLQKLNSKQNIRSCQFQISFWISYFQKKTSFWLIKFTVKRFFSPSSLCSIENFGLLVNKRALAP